MIGLDKHYILGTLAGVFTVGLWGSMPALRHLTAFPPMLLVAVSMASATAVTLLMTGTRRSAGPRGASARAAHWLAGVGGLVGATYFYFLALDAGDPAQVTLITYTWPLGFLLVCDRLSGHGFRMATLFGAAVAFAGISPLLLQGSTAGLMTPMAYVGSVASGASWIAFSVYLRQVGAFSLGGYRRLFVRAGVIALLLHSLFEVAPAAPGLNDWLIAGLIGVGPYGVAFITWGYALRNGPTGLLGVLTYSVPVVSAGLLVMLGWSTPSFEMTLAAAAVCVGAILSEAPWQKHA